MKKFILMTVLTVVNVTIALAVGGVSKVPFADPYILLDGDTYYAYGTHSGDGIECYSSPNLREWTYEGLALQKGNTTETRWFWAPEVYNFGGTYYMYFSANEHLYAATATSPKGPFKQVGSYQMEPLLGSEKCIDSSVFTDDDGKQYMYFVRFTDGNCIWSVQLSDDHITPVEGTLKHCFSVSQSWENVLGRVNEGPNMIKHDGTYYLTYSGNDYQSPDYGVGYATAKSPQGSWSKYTRNPILQKAFGMQGTGHHSLFTDKEGQLRMVFHAHNSSTEIHPRLMYIASMKWVNSSLVVDKDVPIIRPSLPGYPYMPDDVLTKWGYQRGYATVADLNGDGWLDIVAGGSGNTMRNEEASNAFTKKRQMDIQLFLPKLKNWTTLVSSESVIRVADMPSIVPCDINRDGVTDIVAFEAVGTKTTDEAYTGNYGTEGIFLGKGDGKFTMAEVEFKGIDYEFDIKAPAKGDVLDIDNDGLMDVVCAGYQGEQSYNVVLHNLGYEDGKFTFEVMPYETELNFSNIILEAYDMNNDGLTDFLISAYVDNVSNMTRFTDIYLNSPEQPGTFSRLGLGDAESGVLRKAYGALQVADMNNDGHLDFILAGAGDANTGESGFRQRLFLNNGEARPTFTLKESDFTEDGLKTTTAVDNAFGVIDWMGDGNFHVFASGINSRETTTSSVLYVNDGTGNLVKQGVYSGSYNHSIIFPDYNGDGVKDMMIVGQTTDDHYLIESQRGKTVIYYQNQQAAPQRPEPPTNLKAEVKGDAVVLSWEAPASAKGNVTFDFFVSDAEGNLVFAPNTIVGGTNDGKRKVNHLGAAGQNHTITIHPSKSGTFTWGVQTVNAAYDGSVFAEGTPFAFTLTGINEVQAAGRSAQATFNTLGQQVNDGQKGLVIVRKSDGKSQKIIR